MVQLRKPRITGVQVTSRTRRAELDSPNRVTRPCCGCAWPDRCSRDRLCWAAEKADIAREAANRAAPVNRTGSSTKGSTPL